MFCEAAKANKKKTPEVARAQETGTRLLPGILNEFNAPMEGNDNEYADMPELCDAADDSESDEGSTCDVEDSAFLVEGFDETNDDSKNKEDDMNFLGDGWL